MNKDQSNNNEIKGSDTPEQNDKTLRDFLALDRTKLANQRTLLSMIRTALYFTVMGLTIWSLNLLQELRYLAVVLFVLSLLFFLLGLINYKRMNKRMNDAYANFKK